MLKTLSSLSLILILAVGCGGQPDADAPAGDTPAANAPAPAADAQTGQSSSAGNDPCSALSSEEVASILGADAANVQQEAGDAARYSDGRANDCNTTVVHENVETTVTLFVQTKNENAAPDALSQQIQSLLQNGEKIGSQTYVYEPFGHGSVEGALSDVHGGTFVRIRSLNWQADEKLRYRLTVSTTMVGDGEGEPPTPSTELFGRLVDAATN